MSGTPRQYALKAAELLAGVESLSDRLANLTPDERLQMQVDGGMTRANADLRWTVELATAHALTAIALSLLEHAPIES